MLLQWVRSPSICVLANNHLCLADPHTCLFSGKAHFWNCVSASNYQNSSYQTSLPPFLNANMLSSQEKELPRTQFLQQKPGCVCWLSTLTLPFCVPHIKGASVSTAFAVAYGAKFSSHSHIIIDHCIFLTEPILYFQLKLIDFYRGLQRNEMPGLGYSSRGKMSTV